MLIKFILPIGCCSVPGAPSLISRTLSKINNNLKNKQKQKRNSFQPICFCALIKVLAANCLILFGSILNQLDIFMF
jgi:hypothetical protein